MSKCGLNISFNVHMQTEADAEATTLLQFKLHEVAKVTKKQEGEIVYLKEELALLNRKSTEAIERNIEVAKEKLKVHRDKETKRRDTSAMVQKKENSRVKTGTVKAG